jgi:hypothetical protein
VEDKEQLSLAHTTELLGGKRGGIAHIVSDLLTLASDGGEWSVENRPPLPTGHEARGVTEPVQMQRLKGKTSALLQIKLW